MSDKTRWLILIGVSVLIALGAGAMIFLVMSEMIPESRATERQRLSSAVAGVSGFLMMMVIQ